MFLHFTDNIVLKDREKNRFINKLKKEKISMSVELSQ